MTSVETRTVFTVARNAGLELGGKCLKVRMHGSDWASGRVGIKLDLQGHRRVEYLTYLEIFATSA